MEKNNILRKIFVEEDTMAKPLRKGKSIFIFCMCIVTILNFLVFYVAVNFNSILLAFKEYVGNGKYKFSFAQFETVLKDVKMLNEGELFPAFKNTMIYFWANIIIVLPLSYFVSYFIYKKIYAYKFFRVIFFMPSIISSVVLVAVYKNFILPNGALDNFLKACFNTGMGDVFLEHNSATIAMLIYMIWTGFGTNIILYQSAMKRIPESVIEAGKLDGVGMAGEMFKIITPLVWPTVMTTMILAFSGFFTASGPILLFTEGTENTSTISFYIYWQVYKYNKLNYTAAIGIVCTVIGIPIVFLARTLLSKTFETVEY